MVLPLAYLVLRTLGVGAEAGELLFRMRVLETLGRTALLALAVTGASIAVAVPLAWLTVRTDLPFRRVWSVLTVLPLVIPSYVGGMVVVASLGPTGMLQGFLAGPLGVERLPEIYGFPGAMLTLVLLSYPYVLLSVRGSLWGLDPSLEETSRGLGYSSWTTFRKVILPQLRPSIVCWRSAGGPLHPQRLRGGIPPAVRVIYLCYLPAIRRGSTHPGRGQLPGPGCPGAGNPVAGGPYPRSFQLLSQHGRDHTSAGGCTPRTVALACLCLLWSSGLICPGHAHWNPGLLAGPWRPGGGVPGAGVEHCGQLSVRLGPGRDSCRSSGSAGGHPDDSGMRAGSAPCWSALPTLVLPCRA